MTRMKPRASLQNSLFLFFVISVPAFISKPPQSEYLVRKGSDITLKCQAFGNPRPSLLWNPAVNEFDTRYKQAVIRDGFTIERSITIHQVIAEDSKNYTCIAANAIGGISRESGRVIILGKRNTKLF